MSYFPRNKNKALAPKTSLYLPGTSTDYVSCPTSASLAAITGAIDIRVKLRVTSSWAATQIMASANNSGSGSNSWLFRLDAGQPRFFWSTDGTASSNVLAGDVLASVGIGVGDDFAVRVNFNPNDGSGNRVTSFYYSLDNGDSWSQVGSTTTTASTTSLSPNALGLAVGHLTNASATSATQGQFYWAEVRNGIDGTLVASPDFTTPFDARRRDAQGNTWTLNGSTWAWSSS